MLIHCDIFWTGHFTFVVVGCRAGHQQGFDVAGCFGVTFELGWTHAEWKVGARLL